MEQGYHCSKDIFFQHITLEWVQKQNKTHSGLTMRKRLLYIVLGFFSLRVDNCRFQNLHNQIRLIQAYLLGHDPDS